MLKQLAKEDLGNVLKFTEHKTAKTYGPLKTLANQVDAFQRKTGCDERVDHGHGKTHEGVI